MNCQACKLREAEWHFQPFGPDPDASFILLGGEYYRGYPTIKICEACKEKAQSDGLTFPYRKNTYAYKDGVVVNSSPKSEEGAPVRQADFEWCEA